MLSIAPASYHSITPAAYLLPPPQPSQQPPSPHGPSLSLSLSLSLSRCFSEYPFRIIAVRLSVPSFLVSSQSHLTFSLSLYLLSTLAPISAISHTFQLYSSDNFSRIVGRRGTQTVILPLLPCTHPPSVDLPLSSVCYGLTHTAINKLIYDIHVIHIYLGPICK